MRERIALLTGHLARARLERTMAVIGSESFDWEVIDGGVKIAALLTEAIIRRRVALPEGTTRLLLPGRCQVDLTALSSHFGVPVERGPDDIVDLPAFFGRGARTIDLSRHDIRIFSEIIDAPRLTPKELLARARAMAEHGADVIDIGCLPDTPFPHLAESVALLKAEGLRVSVDSSSPQELRTGATAGADFLLSLNEETLDLAFETEAVPVLVPVQAGDLESVLRAARRLEASGKPFLADTVLDPINFGFTASLERYAAFRREMPEAEILMGTGNLTELTEADSLGITATLLAICTELSIRNVLVVQVSPHTRRTLEEHDAARRVLFAARAEGTLPKGYGGALLALHDRRPFASTPDEIAVSAAAVRDANVRIEVASDGINAYGKGFHLVATEAMQLYPQLPVAGDPGHAFYLGAELAKAEIAWRLGKRYAQDEPLDFGCAADRPVRNATHFNAAGPTRDKR
jgi:dihydropteroate synthase-like protein